MTLFITGCTFIPPQPRNVINTTTLDMSFDEAWSKAVEVVAVGDIPIRQLFREDGYIVSEEFSVQDTTYCDCGSEDYEEGGRFPMTSHGRGRLSLLVQQLPSGSRVSVFARYWYDEAGRTWRCESTGKLEGEFLGKFRASR